MKKVILLAALMPFMASGQIIENFESGNLNNWIQSIPGHWQADTAVSLNGRFSLHHVFDNQSGGTDCAGVPLTDLHPGEGATRWSFLIRHGCDPSSSNNWALFLMSDLDPVSFSGGSPVNGYTLGVNLTGYDDTLRLWKIKNGSPVKVVTCPLNWQTRIGTGDAVKIITDRSESGIWTISVYDTGNNLISAATGNDSELFSSSWLILNYRYTSTRDMLLWFDDLVIEGVYYEDKLPPEVIDCRIHGKNSAEIFFNEEPSEAIVQISNFSVNGNMIPERIEKISPLNIRLIFENHFNNKVTNYLLFRHLCDNNGNCESNVEIKFIPVWAEPGDVIISEIMADPFPEVELPGKEYLEILNRTQFSFDLKKWILASENQSSVFPSLTINPGQFLIICPVADTSFFSGYGKVSGLKSFPALTDEGRMIYLTDSLGDLIHGLEYSSDWYGDNLKETGGWSLEMIDPNYPFFMESNWAASLSRTGGTPGKSNSVLSTEQDNVFSGIMNVFPEDSVTIILILSEPVIGFTEYTDRISIGEERISSVSSIDPLYRQFSISTVSPLKRDVVYSLLISGDVTDFAGNSILRNSFRFGMPATTVKGDVVFNELLFNPFPDDPDYVELFNCSDKVIDASRIYLASVDPRTGSTSEAKKITNEHRCIIPGSFYVVTTDPGKVISRYTASDPEAIFITASLPSMPDDRGHLLLLNRELDIIDEVLYDDDMHFPLLADKEGISLEKVRPAISSNEKSNWHTASESSGWGTPGTENSVFSSIAQVNDLILLSSGKISPDNDGYEDVLVIDINLTVTGNVVSVTVFDESGNYIRKLAENHFAGSNASFIWDGTAADGSLVNRGIYILFIEMYNDHGQTKRWKKVCAVIRE
ncbi:MAG: lamin tail domain-containing protein [Bacteroidales bacterium]|jgi:hypothetical protein|nr:lamin tail domain-containing protein [Bacteroidales bacterium]